MPQQPTYPGVYVQEIPSGVRTITGVSTAVTAFIGRCTRGPVDEPVIAFSWADFERTFGGLSVNYPLSYAVRDFFLNGGGQALIVRLFKTSTPPDNSAPDSPPPAPPSGKATFTQGILKLETADPGAWGNLLHAYVDYAGITDEVLERYGLKGSGITVDYFFNLTLRDLSAGGAQERFQTVSLHPDSGARRLDRVLQHGSNWARLAGELPVLAADGAKRPDETADDGPTRFQNGAASELLTAKEDFIGDADLKTGLNALQKVDLFNLLCIPPDVRSGDTLITVYQEAMAFCTRRRALLIVDPPAAWGANQARAATTAKEGLATLGLSGTAARNAALYFPRLRQADSLREGQHDTFVPCGAVAGIMARTDSQRGVWAAPAGLDASISGIVGLEVTLNDDENGLLNPEAINCLRTFRQAGSVVWGARTLRGADQLADDYKYVPVRRLALYIEESLYRGVQWAVFEPNDEPLWSQLRLNVGAFMHDLFRQGAFQGQTASTAYFVKCDATTTTQSDINRGIVNIVVGFAPLKPAEFIMIQIAQMAGQLSN